MQFTFSGNLDLSSLSDSDLKKLYNAAKKEMDYREIDKNKTRSNTLSLKDLKPLVKALGKTLGKNCEVVLHDISTTDSSIIAIENGHVTGRSVGSPVTDFLMEMISSQDGKERDMELNYLTKTKDGRKLKSSTILIRNDDRDIIGCLCINIDLTNIEVAKKYLEDISFVQEEETQESFPEDVSDFLKIMIDKSLSMLDKPVSLLNKDDKLKVVQYLYKNNVFDIKGSIDVVAKTLGVSKYTIYNYIDEINTRYNVG